MASPLTCVLLLMAVLLASGPAAAQEPREYRDPAAMAWVRGILDRISATTGWAAPDFTLTLLDSPEVNAFAGARGDVYVTVGLMRTVESDDELAAVLAHELTHVVRHHVRKAAEKQVLTGGVVSILSSLTKNQNLQTAGRIASNLENLRFARTEESEADELGFGYFVRAGYAPRGLIAMLEKLSRQSSSPEFLTMLSTHPHSADRLRKAKERIAALPPAVQRRVPALSFHGFRRAGPLAPARPGGASATGGPVVDVGSPPTASGGGGPGADRPIGWLGGTGPGAPGRSPAERRTVPPGSHRTSGDRWRAVDLPAGTRIEVTREEPDGD